MSGAVVAPLGDSTPMARNCPLCRIAMQPLAVRRVPLDWCPGCRSIWFDRSELAFAFGLDDAPEVTREQPASRCPACTGLLWFSRLRETNVLACAACGGCFASEAELRKSVGARLQEARFTCTVCGDGYPLAEAKVTGQGLACHRCAPALPPLATAGARPKTAAPESSWDPEDVAEVMLGILEIFL